jgi:hypothetical protein
LLGSRHLILQQEAHDLLTKWKYSFNFLSQGTSPMSPSDPSSDNPFQLPEGPRGWFEWGSLAVSAAGALFLYSLFVASVLDLSKRPRATSPGVRPTLFATEPADTSQETKFTFGSMSEKK